jgi:ABC-type uncharacterized transport system permease subunit
MTAIVVEAAGQERRMLWLRAEAVRRHARIVHDMASAVAAAVVAVVAVVVVVVAFGGDWSSSAAEMMDRSLDGRVVDALLELLLGRLGVSFCVDEGAAGGNGQGSLLRTHDGG